MNVSADSCGTVMTHGGLIAFPRVPKFKPEETETQPLTPEEYERLLASVREAIKRGDPRRKTQSNSGQRSPDEEEKQVTIVRAFLECMRWTGLAIGDTMRLRRSTLAFDERNGLWKVTTKRKDNMFDLVAFLTNAGLGEGSSSSGRGIFFFSQGAAA